MNNQRRKRLQKIIDTINELTTFLEEIRDEEQEAFDNLPESLQESDKGETMNNAISSLDNAIDNLNDSVSEIEDATGA